MLDVISDFWKPTKKSSQSVQLEPEQVRIGTVIEFGRVPQPQLSGRRLRVEGINTYQFGASLSTSFVMKSERDSDALFMVLSYNQGELGISVSRRLSDEEFASLFDKAEYEKICAKPDGGRLVAKSVAPELKSWVAAAYQLDVQGVKGSLYQGNYRKAPLPDAAQASPFTYTLLLSESKEYAIEIEAHANARREVYATTYHRVSEIGEVIHPEEPRGEVKLASKKEEAPSAPPVAPKGPSVMSEGEVKSSPIKLRELHPTPEQKVETLPEIKPAPKLEPSAKTPPATAPKKEEPKVTVTPMIPKESENTADSAKKTTLYVQSTTPENYTKQEIKAVTKTPNTFDADSIECDLRVANKIIDEAIRNEMRLTDVVRRIIELPVAYPEAVQIPITLTDEDFALLAIRYGISSSDRGSIKRRIIEDLNDFSGSNKQSKAA